MALLRAQLVLAREQNYGRYGTVQTAMRDFSRKHFFTHISLVLPGTTSLCPNADDKAAHELIDAQLEDGDFEISMILKPEQGDLPYLRDDVGLKDHRKDGQVLKLTWVLRCGARRRPRGLVLYDAQIRMPTLPTVLPLLLQ